MLLEPTAGNKPLDWPIVYRGLPAYDSDARGVAVWPVSGTKLLPTLGVLGGDDSSGKVLSVLETAGGISSHQALSDKYQVDTADTVLWSCL